MPAVVPSLVLVCGSLFLGGYVRGSRKRAGEERANGAGLLPVILRVPGATLYIQRRGTAALRYYEHSSLVEKQRGDISKPPRTSGDAESGDRPNQQQFIV